MDARRIPLTHRRDQRGAGPGSAATIGVGWLVWLRWAEFGGQIVLAVGATLTLGAEARNILVAALVAVTGLSNAALHAWNARRDAATPPPSWLPFGVLLADTVLLTGILLGSGGPANPFSIFYLVHVAAGALLLPTRALWGLAAASSIGFGSLFVLLPPDLVMRQMHAHGVDFHLRGMWLSATIATVFVGFFVARLARALFQRERDLAELSAYAARTEKLAALSSLAAGAAHELATPIGTIALVAGELSRGTPSADRVKEDAALLAAEAARCRAILDRMQAPGVVDGSAGLGDVVEAMRRAFPELAAGEAPEGRLGVGVEPVAQILSVLVQNAREAGGKRVTLTVRRVGGEVGFTVEDDGPGVPASVLERIGEPFVSSKGAEGAHGLGLFLAARLAERLGGALDLETSERGTAATLVLPGRPT